MKEIDYIQLRGTPYYDYVLIVKTDFGISLITCLSKFFGYELLMDPYNLVSSELIYENGQRYYLLDHLTQKSEHPYHVFSSELFVYYKNK